MIILVITSILRLRVWRGLRDDPDQALLERYRYAGVDLGRPQPVEFFMYFGLEDLAQKAAGKLRADDFDAVVWPDEEGNRWLCLANKTVQLDAATLAEIRGRLTALASTLRGDYDGWRMSDTGGE